VYFFMTGVTNYFVEKCCELQQRHFKWRRERDSNPR
jgi:hypothetical protein